jgi:TolB-like protein
MKRWTRRWIVVMLLFVLCGSPLFADIQQSVLDLLTKLSRDYVEYREEVYFKVPLAVVPFVNSGPLAEQHEIGAVVDELIRSEIANSTYFILTERENLDQILEEIEFSLSDLADTSRTVEVGQLTSARILLAGSVTESGSSFLLNGRLVDVETGVVIGAQSVSIPKEELITEAEAFKYEYVTRYGLGFQALAGADIPVSGIPRSDKFEAFPALVHAGFGVSYRPWRFLQIASSMNVTWTEFQYGKFDPTSADYNNTDWLDTYYYNWTVLPSDTSLPSYSVEYSQKYLDLQVFYVWQPLKPLAVSIGGGGLVGLYTNYVKMKNFPIYIGPRDPVSGEPDIDYFTIFPLSPVDIFLFWIRQDVVIEGGNALTYGLLAALKIEYFISPRLVLSLNATYRKFFPTLAYSYTFGGFSAAEDERFFQLSAWEPGKTPYGDDLDISFHSIGVYLGISGSF